MSSDVLDRPGRSELLSDAEWTDEAHEPIRRSSGQFTIASSTTPVAVQFGRMLLVFSEPLPAWSRETIGQICALGTLQENWNSYGARRIDVFRAKAAVDLVLDLMGPEVPSPAVVPTSGGGIQLEWHRGGMDLEITVESESRFRVTFEDMQTNEELEAEVMGDLRPLADLISRISTVI